MAFNSQYFQPPQENKYATGRNKVNIIAREIRVGISILIEYQRKSKTIAFYSLYETTSKYFRRDYKTTHGDEVCG